MFWDNSVTAWLAASDGNPGEFPEFQNLNHADRTPGSNTLLLFLGNPEVQTFPYPCCIGLLLAS